MNETLNSQLSAFVDGELPEREAELFLRRLDRDDALCAEASRYLQIGRAMRGEPQLPGMRELAGRIAANIEFEDLPATGTAGRLSTRLLRPAGGVAIAGAVAIVALVGLQNLGTDTGPGSSVAAAELAAVAIDEAPLYTEPPVAEFVSDRPGEMLSRYYRHHGERSADMGASNILTRLVTLELREGELVRIAPPTGEPGATEAEKTPIEIPSSTE
ncbi:MAG: sigma-E factor negative regulatory protein [Gammaproteobacteria bacterium]|nr:sigma-E factor negative regulatory protein [Gammaproteobacteria bacterium]MDH4252904.1 sigma-E factor negative regulatory protein [Gammaproteobacteria bacterium]MDH5308410.1 sigma-E factor negative regulatory protein [Gammaproteobacteria bacterium]